MRKVAMVAGGDKEHAHEVTGRAECDEFPAEGEEQNSERKRVDDEKGDGKVEVDFFGSLAGGHGTHHALVSVRRL
jgi:hypothetical protein